MKKFGLVLICVLAISSTASAFTTLKLFESYNCAGDSNGTLLVTIKDNGELVCKVYNPNRYASYYSVKLGDACLRLNGYGSASGICGNLDRYLRD